MSTASGDDLWRAFVEAEREMYRRRADFHQQTQDKVEIIKAALTARSTWDQSAALDFLSAIPGDGPALLPELVDMSTSHGWAFKARQAIDRIPRDCLLPLLEPLILDRLDSADDDEYRRLAELLAHIRARGLLSQLVARALATDDAHIREVGQDFTEWDGPMLVTNPNV
jgi:hypothetical protein